MYSENINNIESANKKQSLAQAYLQKFNGQSLVSIFAECDTDNSGELDIKNENGENEVKIFNKKIKDFLAQNKSTDEEYVRQLSILKESDTNHNYKLDVKTKNNENEVKKFNDKIRKYMEEQVNFNKNFRQGSDFGCCVGVAALKSFAESDIGLRYLNSLVHKDKNNNFVVNLPNKNPIIITKEIVSKYNGIIGNDFAEAIIYALYRDAGNLDEKGNMKLGQYTSPSKVALSERGTFLRLTGLEPNCSHGSEKDLIKIENALNSGENLLMVTSFNDGVQNVTAGKVFPKHEFTLISVDLKNDKIKLANPWYDDEFKIIEMSVDNFQEYNSGINLLSIQSEGDNVIFNRPDIGVKPNEANYDLYFEITSYKPTEVDFNNYFSQDKYNKGENNEFTTSFWSEFDEEGYEYADMKDFRLSSSEISEKMPVYTALLNEGHTPISLIKQYVTNGTIPAFQDDKLKEKTDMIKQWLVDNTTTIMFDIQHNHYMKIKTDKANKKRVELEEKKKAEETAKILQKEEQQRKLDEQLNLLVTQLKDEAFNFRSEGITTAVFPDNFDIQKKEHPNAIITNDSKGNRVLKYKVEDSKTVVSKFDKNGHILSTQMILNGKTISNKTYSYQNDGSRICKINDEYGERIEQEVFNSSGEQVSFNIYDVNGKYAKMKKRIYSSNGKVIKNFILNKSICFTDNAYNIITNLDMEYEYEYNKDGSIKKEIIYIMDVKDGKRVVHEIRTTEYCDDGTQKIYLNDELKAIKKNGKTYDIKGK